MSNNLLWKDFEYEDRKRKKEWYFSVSIISLSIIVASFIFKNYLFSILVLLATITLFLFSIRKPRLISFGITDQGVLSDKILYPFQTLESFWIVLSAEDKYKILIRSKKTFSPTIVIPIGKEIDPNIIRERLLEKIVEEEQVESPAQKIMDYLGF